MQFDFDQFPSKQMRKSQKIEDILDRLEKSSQHSKHNKDQSINFSNFGPIDENQQPGQKSFTSQMFNKPKVQSVRESNQRPQIQYQQESSRDIQQISYLYGQNESFRFQRSMSFEQQNKDNSRFDRLKNLLSKAKSNNLDAFYKNLEQAANQKNQGNLIFQNKNQFKEYTRNMRAQKRQQQAKFQALMEEKKATQKVKAKGMAANLFGDQAFKKKEQGFMILPPEYSQQNYQDQDIDMDFFKTNNQPKQTNPKVQDEYRQQKKQAYMKEAVEFFDYDGDRKQGPVSQGKIDRKKPLESIREEKYTILDASLQQKKFQQLINSYANMKGNYNTLMDQLKQTSNSQYQLMQEMQKIKHQYNTHQTKQKQSRMSNSDEKKNKKQEKQKIKQLKQQQLATIKQEIQEIKTTTNEKDLAYVKINEKIQQLEQLVRVALQEMQEQKQQTNFTPKVINYYNQPQSQQNQRTPSSQNQREQFSDHANLSQQASSMYQGQNEEQAPYQKQYASTDGVRQQQQQQMPSAIKKQRPLSKHQSKVASKIQSHQGSIKREGPQRNLPYVQRNVQKQPLNFVDQFSSPLQLDLSIDINNQNNVSSQSHQVFEIPFYPADGALEYLPLQLDQTQAKNLRNILTQKSSILFESFQFLITVRYTMQDDDIYPVVGSLRLANKCAIDLLDVFVIVYGPQGQNVQVSPSKIFQQRLKYNSNLFFQVRLDKNCIKDNGFNVQVCYKTDSITKKKINFKALLPVVQMIRPEFCYEQNFVDTWESLRNEIYIRPKKLNFKHIRNHEDLKLVLPFIHISEQDPNTFSYGLMFRYPKSQMMFMLKISCYINGKASVHLRSDKNGDQPLKEELLNIINFLFLK